MLSHPNRIPNATLCLPSLVPYVLLVQSSRRSMLNHSMLIFISPSLVSVIPCRPTLFGPRLGVTLIVLPPLFDLSPEAWPPGGAPFVIEPSLLVLFVAHMPSLCCGDCDRTGLLVTLKPGDTARRLIEFTSKSSSLRRFFFRPSAAVGGTIG